MRILPILALCLPLLTGGCFVGDGVAHVVKLASKSSSDDNGSAPQAAPAPAAQPVQSVPGAAAPVDRDPAPMPAMAPVTKIQVEELPPKR